ncbi:MAG: hypothetical protein K9G59_04830 [Caulobacter sp.]|nr:hypothetical protein [Caulobacter sp.]
MTDFDRTPQAVTPGLAPANGMAIASLVLGIVSVLVVWIPIVGLLGTMMALVGLVLGILGLKKPGGRGLAIGGIVCSGVSLVITLLWALSFLAIIGAVAANAN